MEQPTKKQIEGLQIWLPDDNFSQPYNIDALQRTMGEYRLINILFNPDYTPIYVAGNDHVIYHTVGEDKVSKRVASLKNQDGPITASLRQDEPVEEARLFEEAQVRELHLGLGRTALQLAIGAKDSKQFSAATNDLKMTFDMLAQPIHTIEDIEKTPVRPEGLMFMFVLAARRHKTITKELARELAVAIDHGLLPIPVGGFKSKPADRFESWGQARGRGFVDRISFTPKRPKQPAVRRVNKASYTKKPFTVHTPRPRLAERPATVKRPAPEMFVGAIFKEPATRYPLSLFKAHEKYVVNGEPFDTHIEDRVLIARYGYEAYLTSLYDGDQASPAYQILLFMKKKRISRFSTEGMEIVGNLMAAKINASGGIKGQRVPLPGLGPDTLVKGFRALRFGLEQVANPASIPESSRAIGDLVETFLASSFKIEADVFVPTKAPEGVTALKDYATLNHINLSELKAHLPVLDIKTDTYKFGRHIGPGITAEQKKYLDESLSDLRPAKAPEGYMSVSGFAQRYGISKPLVDSIITINKMPVGKHLFGARVGRSLSPTVQEQILKLRFC